jgi:hypothetical protein
MTTTSQILTPGACPATKADGEACRAKPTASGRCVYHNETPELKEARRRGGRLTQARRRLAQAKADAIARLGVHEDLPDLASIETCQTYLVTLAQRTENRGLSPAQTNALVGIVKLSKDLIGLALDVKLAEMLEQEGQA